MNGYHAKIIGKLISALHGDVSRSWIAITVYHILICNGKIR